MKSLCAMPGCYESPRPNAATCTLHQRVTVSGSWVGAERAEEDS